MTDVIITGSAGMPVTPKGRLIFAIDATASRESTWDVACKLQAEMFRSAAPIGQLDVQLVFYRGDAECRASKWMESGEALARLMHKIDCEGGPTQIGRILAHARRETEKAAVSAVTFVGDAMEEEFDELVGTASKLGRLHTPVHMFQEGRDPKVQSAFRLIALRSGGKYHQFNTSTPQAIAQLGVKLAGVARVAVQNAALLTHRK